MKKLILLPAFAMFACVDTGKTGDSGDTATDTEETDTEETDTEETGTEETGSVVPAVELGTAWGDDSVTLTITNGAEDASYFWGIAETTGDCLDSEWGCWTGEDCFQGFEAYTYCHPVDATGGSLSYGATPDAVTEGTDTVFGSADFDTITTHIVDDQSSAEGPCWVWGADTTYYSGYEKTCTEM